MRALALVLVLWSAGALADELDVAALPKPLRADAKQIGDVWRDHSDDPSVLYEVAAIYARAGKSDEAMAVLKRLLATHAGLVPRQRDGFGALTKIPGFPKLLEELRADSPRVNRAKVAFEVKEGDLVPEGIAYSEKTRTFYLGSIKRKIIAVGRDGSARDFVKQGTGGLGGVVGLRVDDARGELWVVSEIITELLSSSTVGVFCFRLSDGALVRAVPIGKDMGQLLNDLAVTRDGSVYVTSTNNGALIRIDPKTHVAKTFLPPRSLPDPNGIAADGDILYIAGWYGITRVDTRTKKMEMLAKPAGVSDGCFDGLYKRGKDLVGIQNCVHDPGRVVRLHLGGDGRRIERAEVLESANSLFEGITTAAIAGDSLFFVANTQFRKVGTDAKFDPLKILTLPLAP